MRKIRKSDLRKPSSVKSPGILGLKRFAAISAVEGLKLSANGRKRVGGSKPTTKRRAEVIRAYLDLKGHS